MNLVNEKISSLYSFGLADLQKDPVLCIAAVCSYGFHRTQSAGGQTNKYLSSNHSHPSKESLEPNLRRTVNSPLKGEPPRKPEKTF